MPQISAFYLPSVDQTASCIGSQLGRDFHREKGNQELPAINALDWVFGSGELKGGSERSKRGFQLKLLEIGSSLLVNATHGPRTVIVIFLAPQPRRRSFGSSSPTLPAPPPSLLPLLKNRSRQVERKN